MPELDDIVQRIAISGQDDVISAFGAIGKAGEEAMSRLARAFGEIGTVAAGFTAALAGTGVALFEWSKHSTDAVIGLRNLANQTGSTITQMSAMQGAIIAMGGSTDGMGMAFRRMSNTVQREWDQIKKSTVDAKDTIVNNQIAVGKAQDALFKQRESYRTSMEALGMYGGQAPTAYEERYQKEHEATLSLQEAEQKLHEARKKQDEDRLNSMDAVAAAIKRVLSGEQTLAEAGKNANLELQNVIKGLVINATPGAADAIKDFSGNITDLAKMAPDVRQVFYNLADFMKNAHNATLEQTLMLRLFGRSMGQDLIYPLKQGSAAIKEQEEELKRFGLVIDDDALKPAEEFHKAYNTLSYALSTTVKQIGLIFDPTFTSGMESFTRYIEENHSAILKWAAGIEQEVRPAIQGFFTALEGLFQYLSGGKIDPTTDVGKWAQSFQTFGENVKKVFDDIKMAAKALKAALDEIRDTINGVFGTKLNDIEILLGGAIAWKLAGSNLGKALLAGILTSFGASGLGGLLLRLAGGGAAGVAAGAAAGAAGAGAAAAIPGLAPITLPLVGAAVPVTAGATAAAGGAAAGAATTGLLAGSIPLLTGLFTAGMLTTVTVVAYKAAKDIIAGMKLTPETPKGEKEGNLDYYKQLGVAAGGLNFEPPPEAKTAIEQHAAALRDEAEAAKKATDASKQKAEADKKTTTIGTAPPQKPGEAYMPFKGVPTAGWVTAPSPFPEAPKVPGFAAAPAPGEQPVSAGGVKLPINAAPPATALPPASMIEGWSQLLGMKTQQGGEGDQKKMGLFDASNRLVDLTSQSNSYLADIVKALSGGGEQKQPPAAAATTTGAATSDQKEGEVNSAWDTLAAAILSGASKIETTLDQVAAKLGMGTAEPMTHAEGGLVGGKGSGKSDSNLIRASKGEYVVTADGSNLGDAIRHFTKGFAMGGLIGPLELPNYATGGVVTAPTASQSRDRHFGTIDLRTDSGTVQVHATDSAADNLSRVAMDRKVSKGGRRQTWWG